MKTYIDAMNETLEYIKKLDGCYVTIGILPAIHNWIEGKIAEYEKYQRFSWSLEDFEEGDILYSEESYEYFAAIFRLGDKKSVMIGGAINQGDYIIRRGDMWDVIAANEELKDEEGEMAYRLATPEEIEFFNDLTGKE